MPDTRRLAAAPCVLAGAGAVFCGAPALPYGDRRLDVHCTAGPGVGRGRLPAGLWAGMVCVLVAGGSLSLSPLWIAMCNLWVTDPLRSIGAVFPVVACAGVVLAWRRLNWEMNGALWALALVAFSILLSRGVSLEYDGQPLINFGGILFLYATGTVLLFGGPRLLRASIAPLCLLLAINPVPRKFNQLVDLPLQQISASTARSFAHLIGLQPSGLELRMMFAPDFGMFIAPGCNGIRGAVALGYLALIFGYARRLRPRALMLIGPGAFLLGYVFNLVRLCVLVLYYRIGLGIASIQQYGAGVDYAIGCTLFLCATLGLGLVIRWLEPGTATDAPGVKGRSQIALSDGWPQASHQASQHRHPPVAGRALCFLALTLCVLLANLRSASLLSGWRPNELQILRSFPAAVGHFRLARTWAEHDAYGRMLFAAAEYSVPAETPSAQGRFTLGLWVGSANHLIVHCRAVQGVIPEWTGFFDATAQQATPVHFLASFYDDGVSRQLDAEATCSSSGCLGGRDAPVHQGFFFTAPGLTPLASAFSGKMPPLAARLAQRSLPILLRREWPQSDHASADDLRAQFEADARLFMAQVDLRMLLRQDGSQL